MLSQEHIARLKRTDLLSLVIRLSNEVPGVTEKVVELLSSGKTECGASELDGDPELEFLNNLLLGSDDVCGKEQTRAAGKPNSNSPTTVDDSETSFPLREPKLSSGAAAFTPGWAAEDAHRGRNYVTLAGQRHMDAGGSYPGQKNMDPGSLMHGHEELRAGPHMNWMAAGPPAMMRAPAVTPSFADPLEGHRFVNGMIFKATTRTRAECMSYGLFGLPQNQWQRVSNNCIPRCTALFLYNTTTNEMEGVFAATEAPGLDLEPTAWQHVPHPKRSSPVKEAGSPFPVQVRIKKLTPWPPASCDRFENLLTWHPNGTSFDIVLDGPTTKALISRLRPDSNPPQTAPATDTLLIPM